jgi:hypothetical protein
MCHARLDTPMVSGQSSAEIEIGANRQPLPRRQDAHMPGGLGGPGRVTVARDPREKVRNRRSATDFRPDWHA